MKENTAKANALLEAARAELAAKRKVRATRFADTVLGWESEEEAARDSFPRTVIGWDHPAANGNPGEARVNALLAEEKALAAAAQHRARRFVYSLVGVVLLLSGAFILAALL